MRNKVVTYENRCTRHFVLVGVVACLINIYPFFTAAKADNRGVDEATLRAAIILKIIHQVNWPQEIGAQINFCSSGNSKSIKTLRGLKGKPITRGNARIAFLTPEQTDTICHVQILGANAILPAPTDNQPLLVICDGCGPQKNNAAVELIKDHDHIRFNLNLVEAKKTHIQFKVSLLELAKTVKGRDE